MQHYIWLIWHNIGEPLFVGLGILLLCFLVPYAIARGIKMGLKDTK